jgi:hypothetical protein
MSWAQCQYFLGGKKGQRIDIPLSPAGPDCAQIVPVKVKYLQN